MKSPKLYAELELLSPEHLTERRPWDERSRSLRSMLVRKLMAWGRSLIITLAGSSDPHIVQRQTSEGQSYFEVYDPISRQVTYLETEQEVRSWLEQRYYQP